MSLQQALYLRLPVPLKQAALNYYGRKLTHHRYATVEEDEREWGLSVTAGKTWEELRTLQGQRLAALIRRAQEQAPYWAEQLAGLRIAGAEELHQAPTLTKRGLREAGRGVVCRDARLRDLMREQTSGST